jgi:hypothetical protein
MLLLQRAWMITTLRAIVRDGGDLLKSYLRSSSSRLGLQRLPRWWNPLVHDFALINATIKNGIPALSSPRTTKEGVFIERDISNWPTKTDFLARLEQIAEDVGLFKPPVYVYPSDSPHRFVFLTKAERAAFSIHECHALEESDRQEILAVERRLQSLQLKNRAS